MNHFIIGPLICAQSFKDCIWHRHCIIVLNADTLHFQYRPEPNRWHCVRLGTYTVDYIFTMMKFIFSF
nr:MAG TPA: hypothetical protein [Caudoviricetes sp.]